MRERDGKEEELLHSFSLSRVKVFTVNRFNVFGDFSHVYQEICDLFKSCSNSILFLTGGYEKSVTRENICRSSLSFSPILSLSFFLSLSVKYS